MSWRKITILGGLFLIVMGGTYFFYLFSPVSAEGETQEIIIESGASFNEIAELLEARGLIRSRSTFKIWSLLSGSAHQLKPGRYELRPNQSLRAILRRLVQGPADIEILITEGKSLKDAEALLLKAGLIDNERGLQNVPVDELKNEFPFLAEAKSWEGFLFPDTYRFAPDSPPRLILKKFLDNFKAKAWSILEAAGPGWYEDLILASLVEREVPIGRERELVSGILRKRLKIGMALQVDATVHYGKCHGRYENCPPLTESDFRVKSVYNTYLYPGLPPAPIANPGRDAILAVLNPKTSSFLYYLSDPETGKTIFSETLEKHNINRARYLHL